MFLGLAKYHIDVVFGLLGIHEVFPYSWLKHPIMEKLCGFFGKVCRSFLGPIADTDPNLDNYRVKINLFFFVCLTDFVFLF